MFPTKKSFVKEARQMSKKGETGGRRDAFVESRRVGRGRMATLSRSKSRVRKDSITSKAVVRRGGHGMPPSATMRGRAALKSGTATGQND